MDRNNGRSFLPLNEEQKRLLEQFQLQEHLQQQQRLNNNNFFQDHRNNNNNDNNDMSFCPGMMTTMTGPSPRYPFTNEPLEVYQNQPTPPQQQTQSNPFFRFFSQKGSAVSSPSPAPAAAGGGTLSLTTTAPQPSGNGTMNNMRTATTTTTNTASSASGSGSSSYEEATRIEDPRLPLPPSSNPPIQDFTSQSTDALLARELNSLSIKERERVFSEIHGVPADNEEISVQLEDETENGSFTASMFDEDDDNMVGYQHSNNNSQNRRNGSSKKKGRRTLKDPEDPQNITKLISEMNMEIQRNITHKEAYLQALHQDPTYVDNKDFLIRFLRADQYEPKTAAHRLVGFFEYKKELFGIDRLTKNIALEDLYGNVEDTEVVESGLYQILPGRDRSGRTVLLKFHHPETEGLSLLSKLRTFYYTTMASLENDEDHKKGIVIVVFNLFRASNRTETWKNCTLLWNMPVRVAAFHICHNGDPKVKLVTSLSIHAMGPFSRMHLRVHEGKLIQTYA